MRHGEPGWFASLLGAAVLIAGGFALGLVAGVVSEEPELVVGHLVGRSDDVDWVPEGEPEFTAGRDARGLPGDDEEILDEVTEFDAGRLAERGPAYEAEAAPELARGARAQAMESPALPQTAAPVPQTAAAPPQTAAALPQVAAAPPRRPLRDVASLPEASRDAAAAAMTRSGFSVQVGAFSDGSSAESVRQKLRRKGFDSYVVPASASGDGKWRVRVGPVPSRNAADSLAGRLKSEERLPTWVLSEGGD